MLAKAITRRLFVVLLGDNDHGKTTMIRSLVRQGTRRDLEKVKRGVQLLQSPWGRSVEALIIPRSYQETLRGEFGSVKDALKNVDAKWRQRDLVLFPSHLVVEDCQTMVKLAHRAGFNAIVVPVILRPDGLSAYAGCLELPWDERWTLANDANDQPQGQIEALGHDLWCWIAAGLEHR